MHYILNPNFYSNNKNIINLCIIGLYLVALIPISLIDSINSFCKMALPFCQNNFAVNVYFTLGRIITVFIISSAFGTLLGYILYRYKPIYSLLFPFMAFLRSIPALVLFTLLVIVVNSHIDQKLMWILSVNVSLWPVVFGVYGNLKNLKEETVYSIKQIKLQKINKIRYIWIPLIWDKTKDNGYKLSMSNASLAIITMEFIIGGGTCNLCNGNNDTFCAPGVGGIFGAIEGGLSVVENMYEFFLMFLLIGILGILIIVLFTNIIESIVRYIVND